MTECDCNMEGSVDNHCDQMSGVCECKDNIGGASCNECKDGYYDFPNCKRKCVIRLKWMVEIPNTYM